MTREGAFSAVESPGGKHLYYSHTRSRGPLLQIPIAGGNTEIGDSKMRWLFFAVTANEVYYYAAQAIWRWSPVTKLAKALLFTQDISQETDLYLIDGLRELTTSPQDNPAKHTPTHSPKSAASRSGPYDPNSY